MAWAIPEFEAKRYEGRLQKGEILLSGALPLGRLKSRRAKEVLKSTGGEDVSSTGESLSISKKTDRKLGRYDCALKLANRRGGKLLAASSSSLFLGSLVRGSKLHSSDK